MAWLFTFFTSCCHFSQPPSLNIVQRHALWLFRIRVDGPCSWSGHQSFPSVLWTDTVFRLCATHVYMYGAIWISCILDFITYQGYIVAHHSYQNISEYQVQYIIFACVWLLPSPRIRCMLSVKRVKSLHLKPWENSGIGLNIIEHPFMFGSTKRRDEIWWDQFDRNW